MTPGDVIPERPEIVLRISMAGAATKQLMLRIIARQCNVKIFHPDLGITDTSEICPHSLL
jgi:hypothetical protein